MVSIARQLFENATEEDSSTMSDERNESPSAYPATTERAITIRPGVATDAPTIIRFQIDMAIESENLVLDPAAVGAGVEAVFADPRRGGYWVAEAGKGRLLGCLLTIPEWSDWRNGVVLWIHSVYVVPTARRRGIYARLYRHLQSTVRNDPGLRGLRLYVDKGNASAQRAYERLGMTRDHYHLYEWLEDG